LGELRELDVAFGVDAGELVVGKGGDGLAEGVEGGIGDVEAGGNLLRGGLRGGFDVLPAPISAAGGGGYASADEEYAGGESLGGTFDRIG
jgi:hypothetical protein